MGVVLMLGVTPTVRYAETSDLVVHVAETVGPTEGTDGQTTLVQQSVPGELGFNPIGGVSSSVAPLETESARFSEINKDRLRYGLASVDLDLAVIEIARARAAEQVGLAQLSHFDATGQLAFVTSLERAGVGYRIAAENLARWVATDPLGAERIEQALMASSQHRANILNPAFDRLAVGAATGPDGRISFSEIFRAAP